LPFYSQNTEKREVILWSWVCSSISMLQTCKRICVAGRGTGCGMTSLCLSTLEMLSSYPHQSLQRTATRNSPLDNRRQFSTIVENKIYLMNSECKSNSLDNKLFFFRPTTNCLKLSRDSLHILHGQFYRCQLDLPQFNIHR